MKLIRKIAFTLVVIWTSYALAGATPYTEEHVEANPCTLNYASHIEVDNHSGSMVLSTRISQTIPVWVINFIQKTFFIKSSPDRVFEIVTIEG